MPDQPDKIDQTIDSDNVYCAHCGTENVRGGYSCTRCGERMLVVTTDTPSPMGLVSCARCGGANFNRAVHCWVCGTEMNDTVRISPATPVEPAPKARTYEPELNPISVPAPAREPKDDRADLRGPAADSISGSGPGTSVGPAPVANDAAMSEEPVDVLIVGAGAAGAEAEEVVAAQWKRGPQARRERRHQRRR